MLTRNWLYIKATENIFIPFSDIIAFICTKHYAQSTIFLLHWPSFEF